MLPDHDIVPLNLRCRTAPLTLHLVLQRVVDFTVLPPTKEAATAAVKAVGEPAQ